MYIQSDIIVNTLDIILWTLILKIIAVNILLPPSFIIIA